MQFLKFCFETLETKLKPSATFWVKQRFENALLIFSSQPSFVNYLPFSSCLDVSCFHNATSILAIWLIQWQLAVQI